MFARPGITALRDQAVADMLVSTGLPTLLRRSPLRALAYALAGLAHGQYGYLDWIARQSTPFTATGLFLEAWAALVGIMRKPKSLAAGAASFIGTVGKTVPVGTVLRRGDGAGYLTTAAVTLAGDGTGTAAIQAVAAGSAYSLDHDTPLSLAAPLDGVRSDAVGQPVTPGADPELDAPFRTRTLLRWSAPPQGGSESDYVTWALEVPGVTRAWDIPLGAGEGTVVVYTMWDTAEAAHGGFPQGVDGVATSEWRGDRAAGDQLLVADALFPLRPATALVYSCAPLAYPVNFAIQTPTAVPAAIQSAAAAALDAVFLANADPKSGVLQLGPFDAAIAQALGSSNFTRTAPGAPVAAPVGRLPVRGLVSWSVAGG